ncbi:hypothetical protein GCM10009668_14180 [Nocardioides dubius]|uniref:SD-repeat containing protein B domain-containing protein n=1 Tax=Nocardioides dubius TaxID=317019 RepID=A0ABN1TQV1_9ACTN
MGVTVAGLTAYTATAPAQAAPGDGTIKIRVVQDYNGNGSWDDAFIEPGLANVDVDVTDEAGVTQTLQTDADGLITLVGPPGSYRVVAQNPDPTVLQPAPAREKTGTADTPSAQRLSSNEEFLTVAANQTAEMTTAFWDIRDYCQSNPLIVNACQPPIFAPNGTIANNATAETLFTAPYRGNGVDAGKTVLSTKADTGSLYGIGYQRNDRKIFAAAFAKRGVAYGSGGPGAIYTVSADGGPTTLWGTVPNVGSREHSFETAGLRQDWDFAPAVGKESLGDLDISEDGDDLQVLNLFTRELYVYDARAATMGAPTHVVDLSGNPEGICATGSDWRPGALAERKGVLYVGGVCSAESTQDPNDMRAVILTLDAEDYTPTGVVMDQTINRKRELNAFLASRCDPRDVADGVYSTSFRPWSNEGIDCNTKSGVRISDPQAWMDDIVVENNGDLIIAFRDRTGDQQMGLTSRYYENTDGTGDLVGIVDYVVAGDINKACRNEEDELVLDINGACGIPAPLPGERSGEYFTGDGGVHAEEAYGGLALSRGERGIASSAMDPAGGIFSQGYFRMDRGTGLPIRAAGGGTGTDPQEVLQSPGGNSGGNAISGASAFSKGQGMADMEVLCDFAPIQIGNRVWDDEDGDGVQDAGEAGISGVTVNLYEADGVTLVATTVTNSRGEYYFDSITDGVDFNTDYVVRIDKPGDYTGSGKLAGLGLSNEDSGTGPDQDRLDSDGVMVGGYPQATITTGNRGENDHTIDFGFSPAAVSVGNFVWVDSDGDGVQDPGEPGIPGVQLTLTGPGGGPVTDVNGDPVGPVTTDANGRYVFDKLPVLPAGQSYTVHIDNGQSALEPYLPTQAGQGTDPAQDSSTGSAASGDLSNAGDRDLTLDFGFIPRPVAVGDLVWVDTDGDGIQDPGEPGIPGVQLTLTGPDGNPVTDINGDPVGPVTTDANGFYVFTDLPVLGAGESYTVHIDNGQPALAPYLPTQAGQGTDPGSDSSTGSAESGPLTTPDARDMTLDFGFVPAKVSVGDYVWLDSNRDGIQDSGEDGIEGVVLVLTGPDGEPVTDVNGNPVGPQTTDADGRYSFDNLPVLPAGQHYTVSIDRDANSTITALSGLQPTQSGQGNSGNDSSTWTATSGDLTSDGDRDPTLDFGFNRPSVSVGNLVWEDLNKDGIQDSGEPGIEGVVLVLTGPDGGPVTDVDGNPVGPVTTDADGNYSFDNLPALPAGYSYTVSIDRDHPSTQEALAPYVPSPAGAGDDDGADSSTWTAESGDLTENGDRDPTLDFGFFRPEVSVGDYVWLDADHDGIQDAGEDGIAGVVLVLTGPDGEPVTDIHGDPVGPATTDANGEYSFDHLPPLPAGQSYTVTIDTDASAAALAGLAPTLTGQGNGETDSSTGSATSGDLTEDGDRDPSLDFGFYPLPGVSVGDLIWFDKDRDGVQDAGEPGIEGVVLVLRGPDGNPVTDIDGNPVGPVTTGPDGLYSFANLPPLPAGQSYTVAIDRTASAEALAPYVPTKPGAGSPATDSSTWTASSGNLTTNGDRDLTLDFGFVLRPAATLATKTAKKVVAKVNANGTIKPVALTDTVKITNLLGTGEGVARLYGPASKRSSTMCTPANLAGTVKFTARNGTHRTPAVKVRKPGVYTWVVTIKTKDGSTLSHKCGLASETTTVQRQAYGPIDIETGRSADVQARFIGSAGALTAAAMGTKNAPLVTVGLNKREMIIPKGVKEIGWLNRSAAFGDLIGTAVVAAHVSDNSDRSMAFRNLTKLKKGKVVTIKKGGKTYRYKVTSTAKFSRDKGRGIPKRYFKTTGEHRLVLVTCTDKVTYKNGRFHYTNNLVVTAKLIK